MSTAAIAHPAVSSSRIFARTLRNFGTEVRFELLRALRTRAFTLVTIGFPVMFYVLFGIIMNHGEIIHGVSIAKYMLGGYAVFGLVGASLFGIGVGLANELGAGWLELKRASPMPPLAYLAAKCVTAAVFGAIIVTILCVLGVAAGHVPLSMHEYIAMMALTVAGAVPFACMGLALALIVPSNSAPGVANMIYLPMSFLSGLWIPVFLLPKWLQHITPILPSYHLAQLMLGIYGYQALGASAASHWFGLLGFTLVMMGVAAIAFRRREQNA
jgi:ABC-2 type transport system permease protein